MTTIEILCIVLIIAIVVISWIWAIKALKEDGSPYKVIIAYLLSIVGFGIIGAIFWGV